MFFNCLLPKDDNVNFDDAKIIKWKGVIKHKK